VVIFEDGGMRRSEGGILARRPRAVFWRNVLAQCSSKVF
jgi:hypothetical protein